MTDIETQYKAVREGVGMIDRSDVGKIAIYGEDRFTWLQGMVSNDVRQLANDNLPAIQACILTPTGQIVSDLMLINIINAGDQEGFILVILPGQNVEKVVALLDRYLIMEDVRIEDVTRNLASYSFQGPLAQQDVDRIKRVFGRLHNEADCNIFSVEADHTGSGGYDLVFNPADASNYGSPRFIKEAIEIEPEMQEILRVEAGVPKYGVDMDETTLAPEAGLMATHISLTKGCYVGQEIVARIDSRGHTNRALTGLVFEMGAVPTSGDKIIAGEESGGTRETGRVTSVVTASPAMNGRPIAMGYVRHEHRTPGNWLQVQGTNSSYAAQVVELPFYRRLEANSAQTKGVESGT